MQIDKIIISSNDNPEYLQFVKIVGPAWKKLLNITPTLMYVSNKTKEEWEWMEEYVEVIQVPDVDHIPSANQAQVSRLIQAAQYQDEVCMLSDLDMLPLSGEYFTEATAPIPLGMIGFIGGNAYSEKYKAPICYMIAQGKTFADIFNQHGISNNSYEDLIQSLYDFGKGKGNCDLGYPSTGADNRFCDESLFEIFMESWPGTLYGSTTIVREWNRNTNLAENRLDRADWVINHEMLNKGEYYDAHMVRPLDKHYEDIKPLTDYLGIPL